MMERTESGGNSSTQISSVKEAVSLYGARITRPKPADPRNNNIQLPFLEKAPSKARELHLAKKDLHRYNESRDEADHLRSQAESELFSATQTVKALTLQIEESKLKATAKKSELETLSRQERHGGRSKMDNPRYEEVMQELKSVKEELSKLKLDMAYLSEIKAQADKETEASNSRIMSYSNSIEALKKDIEEANEEEVLVELARIEALKECKTIEAQRAENATHYLTTIKETRKKIKDVSQEVENSKELETKLAITKYDVDVLNELKLVKAMDKTFQFNETSGSEQPKAQRESSSSLELVTAELEEAKKELATIREEGFQFMSSMDIIRDELKHVSEETDHLRKLEEKSDLAVQVLNSKLLRAKSKLEAVSSAEEKAKAIVSSLSATLQQISTEAEAAKKERELVTQEAKSIMEETQKTETEIDIAEERLQVAMEELEAVKASEALALDNLKTLTERTMRARSSKSEHSSLITISHFEYKYLSGHAEGVEEIADKKVAAAQAWIEAMKAGEKEILMKTEIMLKELRELKGAEENEQYRKESSQQAKTSVEVEFGKLKQQGGKLNKEANLQVDVGVRRKSMKDTGNSTPMRKGNPRRLSSSGARHVARTNSIALKKKTKVMPNIGRLFGGKKNEQDT